MVEFEFFDDDDNSNNIKECRKILKFDEHSLPPEGDKKTLQ
jgi:hypothetical protein